MSVDDGAERAGSMLDRRRLALQEHKRQWIRDAAKEDFARQGISRASMRDHRQLLPGQGRPVRGDLVRIADQPGRAAEHGSGRDTTGRPVRCRDPRAVRLLPGPASYRARAVAASTYVFGLILMAHTGRLRSFGQDPDELLELYLDFQLTAARQGDPGERQ
jgi:hypothetical protein